MAPNEYFKKISDELLNMVIPVTADMRYKVNDNSQCDENTRFE